MHHRAVVLFSACVLACSGEAPAAPTIVTEPSAPVAEASPPEVRAEASPGIEPPIEALAPVANVTVPVFTPENGWADREVAWVDIETGTVTEEGGELRYPRFDVPERDALTRLFTSELESWAVDARDPSLTVDCSATLATSVLVSVQCTLSGSGGRTGFDEGRASRSYSLENGEVHEAPPAASVLPGTDLRALARAACERTRAERIEDGDDEAELARVCELDGSMSYGDRGYVVVFSDEEYHHLETEVRYDAPELRGRLRADGPLGRLLPIGERAQVDLVGDDAVAATLALDGARAWAFGPPSPLEAALSAIDRSAEGPGSVFVGAAGARAAHRGEAATPADVTRLADEARAHAAGAALYQVPPDRVLGVSRLVVTTPINVRQAPSTDGAWRGTLSIGTRVVGLDGTLEGHRSARGGRGSWLWVMAAEGLSGWVSGRYLDAAPAGPRPELTAHGSVPDDAFAQLGRHALFGSVADVHFAILASRPRSWLLVSGSPRFTEITRTLEVEGHLEEVRWSMTRDGVAVAIVGTATVLPGEPGFDGTMHWHLFAPGASTPGWSADARTHPGLIEGERDAVAFDERAAGTTFSFTVTPHGGRTRRVRWDGTSFVER